MAQQAFTSTRLDQLPLPAAYLDQLRLSGKTFATPVQARVIPLAVTGKDLLFIAQVGGGKTLVYEAALNAKSHEILKRKGLTTLIVSPTRPLAAQIYMSLLVPEGAKKVLCDGGGSVDKQIKELVNSQPLVVIGTPGRLFDLQTRGVLTYDNLLLTVWDEVDMLWDGTYAIHLNPLVKSLPPRHQRQNLACSGTSPTPEALAGLGAISPDLAKNTVSVAGMKLSRTMSGSIIRCRQGEELAAAVCCVVARQPRSGFVFCTRTDSARALAKTLRGFGIKAAVFTAKMAADEQVKLFQQFDSGELTVLVSSGILERGINRDPDYVILADRPELEAELVQRAGRTARLGKDGEVIFVLKQEDEAEIIRWSKNAGLVLTVEHPSSAFGKIRTTTRQGPGSDPVADSACDIFGVTPHHRVPLLTALGTHWHQVPVGESVGMLDLIGKHAVRVLVAQGSLGMSQIPSAATLRQLTKTASEDAARATFASELNLAEVLAYLGDLTDPMVFFPRAPQDTVFPLAGALLVSTGEQAVREHFTNPVLQVLGERPPPSFIPWKPHQTKAVDCTNVLRKLQKTADWERVDRTLFANCFSPWLNREGPGRLETPYWVLGLEVLDLLAALQACKLAHGDIMQRVVEQQRKLVAHVWSTTVGRDIGNAFREFGYDPTIDIPTSRSVIGALLGVYYSGSGFAAAQKLLGSFHPA